VHSPRFTCTHTLQLLLLQQALDLLALLQLCCSSVAALQQALESLALLAPKSTKTDAKGAPDLGEQEQRAETEAEERKAYQHMQLCCSSVAAVSHQRAETEAEEKKETRKDGDAICVRWHLSTN